MPKTEQSVPIAPEMFERVSDDMRKLQAAVSEIERSRYFARFLAGILTEADIVRMERARTYLNCALAELNAED